MKRAEFISFYSVLTLIVALLAPTFVLAATTGEGGALGSYGAFSSDSFAGGVFTEAICDLYSMIGGSLGAMLSSVACLTALGAAAMGGFQNAKSAVAVAIAAFAMTAGVSLYFGSFTCN